MKQLKTRIRKEESEGKVVYSPEFLHEVWILKSWTRFSSLTSPTTCNKACMMSCDNTKESLSSLEFSKEVIDCYISLVEEENKNELHHETKKISFIEYP